LRGRILLGAVDLRTKRRNAVARQIAIVPQETHLAFEYTVLEMALMGRYPHLGAFEVEGPADVDLARAALESTGTRQLESRYFNTLSGGEKQRVVIAAALAQLAIDGPEHSILLLDEPTSSLDLAYQIEIQSILRALNRDRQLTIVVATHDLNFASGLCNELVLVDGGRVLASGRAENMLEPELIRELYGVEVGIATHPATGLRAVIPVARLDRRV
jgi:iron complex transport system ATP-binding protein